MLRILAYMSLFTFLAINTYFLLIASDDIKQVDVSHRLSYLEHDYQDCIYECFFALDEVRPYAIIQVDRLIEVYNNAWIEPDKVASMLTASEKRVLLSKVTQFVEEKEEVEQSILLNKIVNWCRVKKLFSVIDTDYGFPKSDLVEVTSHLDATSYIIQSLTSQSAQADMSTESLSLIEQNEVYYKTINHISGLQIQTQFDLYSQIFKKLAKTSE